MLRLLLIKSISLFALVANAQNIGDVVEHTGVASIQRQQDIFDAILDTPINMYDEVRTGNGRMKVEFLDSNLLSLTEQTKVYIDEVYYDPNPSNSKMSIRFAMGTARFASGKLGLIDKQNINLQTPTATIAVRGTDFTTTVDELGRSLVLLLPDASGGPSGEIVVSNLGGSVTLNEVYQATMVSTLDSPPAEPVTLENINVQMIDNMFIVNPPQEIQQAEEETTGNDNNTMGLLDVDFLAYDELDKNYLEEENLAFTELDMDLLDVNFFVDLLSIIEDIDLLEEESLNTTFSLAGTNVGQDKETGWTTIVDEGLGQIWFYKNLNGTVSIRLPIDASALIRVADEREQELKVNDGSAIYISITQQGG